jgi:hypothetical protein
MRVYSVGALLAARQSQRKRSSYNRRPTLKPEAHAREQRCIAAALAGGI